MCLDRHTPEKRGKRGAFYFKKSPAAQNSFLKHLPLLVPIKTDTLLILKNLAPQLNPRTAHPLSPPLYQYSIPFNTLVPPARLLKTSAVVRAILSFFAVERAFSLSENEHLPLLWRYFALTEYPHIDL